MKMNKKNSVEDPLLQTDGKCFWDAKLSDSAAEGTAEFYSHCYVLGWQLYFRVIAYKIYQKLKSCWNETEILICT